MSPRSSPGEGRPGTRERRKSSLEDRGCSQLCQRFLTFRPKVKWKGFPLTGVFEITSRSWSILFRCHWSDRNRPRSIHQYSNMAPRLSGQTSIFGVVFFVSKSPLGQKKLKNFTILTRKPRSHVRILIYRTWPICVTFFTNWLNALLLFNHAGNLEKE